MKGESKLQSNIPEPNKNFASLNQNKNFRTLLNHPYLQKQALIINLKDVMEDKTSMDTLLKYVKINLMVPKKSPRLTRARFIIIKNW